MGALCRRAVFGLGIALTIQGMAAGPATAETGVTVDDVLAVLRAAGVEEVDTSRTGEPSPRLGATVYGIPFTVHFYGCEAGRCASFEFAASYFDFGTGIPLDVLNDWNAETIFGKAVHDSEGYARLEYGVLATGGIGRGAIAATFDQWVDALIEFENFLVFDAEMGGTGGGAAPAQADASATLDVCNESGDEVSVAYATAAGGSDSAGRTLFRSQGWRNIPDGECSVFWEAPFDNRYYYVFARAADGYYGGDYYFCTLGERFEIVDAQCDEGYEREGFLQIDMAEGSRMQEGFRLDLTP